MVTIKIMSTTTTTAMTITITITIIIPTITLMIMSTITRIRGGSRTTIGRGAAFSTSAPAPPGFTYRG
jgi:cell division protein FtsX